MSDRRSAFLREMGIAPQWALRTGVSPGLPMDSTALAPVVSRAEAGAHLTAFTPALPSSDWPTLQIAVKACAACPRAGSTSAGGMAPLVGSGDPKAAWLFIAGAPNADEAAQGGPLVGAAGRLFDNMLAALGLRLGENVYLTHAVKCHSGERSAAEDSAACASHLQSQISLLRPAVIVALGADAAAALTPGALRGSLHRHGDIPLVVTHAPAELLKNPAAKAQAWADLCLAMDARSSVGADAAPA